MLIPRVFVAVVAACLLIVLTASASAELNGTAWVSLDTNGSPAGLASGAYSYPPSLTGDGGLVAFESVAGLDFDADTNGAGDVYLRDLTENQTSIISVNDAGQVGNGKSYGPDISADGALIAFESLASNLDEGDANDSSDIYLRDRTAGTTRRVSVPASGGDSDDSSYRSAISDDGNFVAFCSRASNLVSGDTNGLADAFLWERTSGGLTHIAVPEGSDAAADGCLRVSVSGDGAFVAFAAVAAGTAGIYLYDRAGGTTTALTARADGPSGSAGLSISGDGGIVAFDSLADNLVADDTNRSRDVFAYDRDTGAISRVSVRSSGSQLPGDSGASGLSLSRDGNFVVFGSTAKGVVPGDSNGREDIFRRDVTAGQTLIVSVNTFDESANNSSYSPSVSSDGLIVAFTSMAANLVAGDSNRQPDVYVRGTSFLERAGSASGPEETGAPQQEELEVPISTEDKGLPSLVTYGGIGAGVIVFLVTVSLVLGRRGRA